MNVADDGTRAKISLAYNPNSRWITGPDFLLKDQTHWPSQPQIVTDTAEIAVELRAKHHIFVATLKRSTAWILRFVRNCKAKRLKRAVIPGGLTADEEMKAEIYLFRAVQREVYCNEYEELQNNKPINKKSTLVQLNPYIDEEGVLRFFMPLSAKRLIILPKDHTFTRLIVVWHHVKWRHINTCLIINEIRQRFWVPSLRVLVKSVASNCNICRIRRTMPAQPIMAPLPVDRLTAYIRPFTYSGVDFFGPVTVSVRRQKEKRWVALFTCLTTRAVHLELAADLTSDAFLLCIRNFINRRGVPIQLRSDNGTNFVGLPKELRGTHNFMDHDTIKEGLQPLGIRWKFNCPSNPSEGGVWERLVQSVKKALYIMLKVCAPRVDTLNSLLIEAENIVNSRPLTHLPVTPDDPEPLTPNHFLLHSMNSTQTPAPMEKKLLCMRKQWRIAQTLKNGFWKQWMLEYLPELTRRSKWCQPSKALNVNDQVLICETGLPRSQWKRGRVLKLYQGQDGVARSADAETSQSVLKRPISKLAKLDVVETL